MARENETNSTGEIEITPKMIEAGVIELCAYGPESSCCADGVVKEIFLAMVETAPKKIREDLIRCLSTSS